MIPSRDVSAVEALARKAVIKALNELPFPGCAQMLEDLIQETLLAFLKLEKSGRLMHGDQRVIWRIARNVVIDCSTRIRRDRKFVDNVLQSKCHDGCIHKIHSEFPEQSPPALHPLDQRVFSFVIEREVDDAKEISRSVGITLRAAQQSIFRIRNAYDPIRRNLIANELTSIRQFPQRPTTRRLLSLARSSVERAELAVSVAAIMSDFAYERVVQNDDVALCEQFNSLLDLARQFQVLQDPLLTLQYSLAKLRFSFTRRHITTTPLSMDIFRVVRFAIRAESHGTDVSHVLPRLWEVGCPEDKWEEINMFGFLKWGIEEASPDLCIVSDILKACQD